MGIRIADAATGARLASQLDHRLRRPYAIGTPSHPQRGTGRALDLSDRPVTRRAQGFAGRHRMQVRSVEQQLPIVAPITGDLYAGAWLHAHGLAEHGHHCESRLLERAALAHGDTAYTDFGAAREMFPMVPHCRSLPVPDTVVRDLAMRRSDRRQPST